MKFRKVYIEITNRCNLSCSFCSISKREKKDMSIDAFKHVIEEVKKYSKTIYLHVKGEPLLHPHLDALLSICDEHDMRVNITTNATLLESRVDILKKHPCVRKLNISLHSENKMENYYKRVMNACDCLENVYIVYRLWTLKNYALNEEARNIIEAIKEHYHLCDEVVEKIRNEKHIQIQDHVIIDKENMFVWPDLNNDFTYTSGYCYALKTHIAILANGDVVPCCLDGEGILKLGNIHEESLEEILHKERSKNIKKSFQDRRPCEKLCQKCGFLSRLETIRKV